MTLAARLAAFVLCVVPAAAHAQTNVPDEESRNSLALAGSGTFANGSIEGDAFDRHLYLIGVRYGRLLAQNGMLTFSYTPEVVPAAWLTQPVQGDGHLAVQRNMPPYTHTETTFGAGASPIGVELRFTRNGRLQPVVGTNEGFLYFSRNVPSLFAAQFNFTIDVRLGLRLRLTSDRALLFEYAYHHLSNGYHARENPGMDSQLLCVGYGLGR